jgi:hypothetical protein
MTKKTKKKQTKKKASNGPTRPAHTARRVCAAHSNCRPGRSIEIAVSHMFTLQANHGPNLTRNRPGPHKLHRLALYQGVQGVGRLLVRGVEIKNLERKQATATAEKNRQLVRSTTLPIC